MKLAILLFAAITLAAQPSTQSQPTPGGANLPPEIRSNDPSSTSPLRRPELTRTVRVGRWLISMLGGHQPGLSAPSIE